MDADGGNPEQLTELGAQQPAWSPDGTMIAFWSFRDNNSEVYVMDADGSDETNISQNPTSQDQSPSWSLDGSRVAFVSKRSGTNQIWTIEFDGSDPVNLTNDVNIQPSYPAWSADGTKIAYEFDARVWTMNASNGSNKTPFTSGPAMDDSPKWSPDSAKIIFEREEGDVTEVYVMDAATGDNQGEPHTGRVEQSGP